MKKLQKARLALSILMITHFCHAANFVGNWLVDKDRYYGAGQGSPDSYIDNQTNINPSLAMRSYIIANPYPSNYPGGDGKNYNLPGSPNQQYFQPSDGSFTNGTYDVINKTAVTPLHSYNNVVIIDGSINTPTLNPKGQYVDKNGKEYKMIGSAMIPSEDMSDENIYYFFGQLADPKNNDADAKKAANVLTQTYNSQGE